MALTFKPSLKTTLDTATSKLDWANKLQAALGNTRRVRCFRDANANATDPSVTGTEFLNIGATGALTSTAGNITGLGALSGATIHLSADLSTGASVLRIEGNGNWVQGTLGLTGGTTDFVLSANPTGTSGVAFVNAGAKAPHLLASGTGPAAPPIKPTTPTIIELVDWTDPNNPVVVGTATFSVTGRQDDWVYDDQSLASEVGDVAVYQLNSTIKWTSPPPNQRFELGGLLLIAANYNSSDGVTQLEQVLLAFKPLGRWASYPAMDTYVPATWSTNTVDANNMPTGVCTNAAASDSTYPPPFKINLKTANGTIVYTHEMKAFQDTPTLPINSPQLSQTFTTTKPCIPHFNCAQWLPWQNIRTKVSALAGKYFNGVGQNAFINDTCRDPSASNGSYPIVQVDQINSVNHFFMMPEYPMLNAMPNYNLDTNYMASHYPTPADPYGVNLQGVTSSGFMFTGWRYQPGSNSGHDWRTGPGGVRFDRSVIPSVIALWGTNPNYTRPLGNTPIRDMVEAWSFAYFNHSCHYVTDALTFKPIPQASVSAGNWSFFRAYYGYGPFRPTSTSIDMEGIANGDSADARYRDATGRLPYGGWERDSLHAYANTGWMALLLNSPMHAIAQTHQYNANIMSNLSSAGGGGSPIGGDPNNTASLSDGLFMYRTEAWHFLSYAVQYGLSSQHPLGYTRELVMSRFQTELEALYDYIYVPVFVNNVQNPYYNAIRNLGIPIKTDGTNITSAGGSLAGYMTHALVLMKQTGLWSAMKQRSAKCKAALEMFITCMDKWNIDYILDTNMRDSYYPCIVYNTGGRAITTADIPANWAAQSAYIDSVFPVLPSNATTAQVNAAPGVCQWQNFTLMYDGTCGEQTGCPHLFYQYAKARQYYFPEYPNSRTAGAIAKMESYYAAHANARANGKAYRWDGLIPSHGDLLAPTVVGPN